MMNLFTKAAGLIILVMSAAFTVGLTGCDGDGGEAPESPSPADGATPTATAEAVPTPEHTAQPSSPAPTTAVATVVQRYEPPASLPDPASLPSVDCWTSSGTGRADAFRCSTDESVIHAFCFLDMEAMILACPRDPRDDSTTFYARWGGESGDPGDVRAPAGPESPWFLVLDAPGSPACRLLTGATIVLPGGARMDFDCAGPCASPESTGPSGLEIVCYPGAEPGWSEEEMLSVETLYGVAEAWY